MKHKLRRLLSALVALGLMLGVGAASTVAYSASNADASQYFHPTITTESDYVANLQYASFNVKYTIDHGKIHAGDYIMVTVPQTLNHVSLSYSSLLFSGKQDLDGGRYKLIFNANAVNGISGSFSISAFGNNDTSAAQTATVQVGNTHKSITVGARHDYTGSTIEDRAIVKWAPSRAGYADYRQDTAVSGVYDPDKDVTIDYAISVDPRLSVMKNATVTDVIPDAATLDPSSIRIATTNADGSWAPDVPQEEVTRMTTVNGNALSINFGDMLDGKKHYRVQYSAIIPKDTKVAIKNTANIEYDSAVSSTVKDVEASTFTVKPMSGYSASLGYKSVDKTEVTDDPSDQTVTYTISFENDQQFAAKDINLTDTLDPDITYVDSYGSDYFSLSYNQATHAVHITNTKPIPASMKQDVTIVTDFSKAKVGQTVSNTVGGNTVKTKKADGSLTLTAHKSVDGEAPGNRTFDFQLLDKNGTVLQMKQNGEDGTVSFDPIDYGENDNGKEFTYTVRESANQKLKGYVLDDSVYTVTVTPIDRDNDRKFECTPTITKNGSVVDTISFNNTIVKTGVTASEKGAGKPSSTTKQAADQAQNTLAETGSAVAWVTVLGLLCVVAGAASAVAMRRAVARRSFDYGYASAQDDRRRGALRPE